MLKRLLFIALLITLLAACLSNAVQDSGPASIANRAAANPDGALARIGDPERGQALFITLQSDATVTCSNCHRTSSEQRLVGPGLLNVSSRAEHRVSGRPAEQYLYDSITNPSAYVVDGYPDIMPKNWGAIFSGEELADIIAYLMTLH